jgi:hypothetical protein
LDRVSRLPWGTSLPTACASRGGLSTNRQLGTIAQAAELIRVFLGDGHDGIPSLAGDARDDKLGEFRQNGERFIYPDILIGVDLTPIVDSGFVDLGNGGRFGDRRSARLSFRLVCASLDCSSVDC